MPSGHIVTLVAVCLSAVATTAGNASGGDAAAALGFDIAALDGDGWRAEGVEVDLAVGPEGRLSARVRAERLELPEPVGPLSGVSARCGRLSLGTRRVRCESFLLEPHDDRLPFDSLTGQLTLDRATGAIEVVFATPDGRLEARAVVADGGWRVESRASGWELPGLAGFLADGPDALAVAGRLDATLLAHGEGPTLGGAVFEADVTGLSVANDSGTLATQDIAARLAGSAGREGDGLQVEVAMRAFAGEAYAEPVYLDFGSRPASFRARGGSDGEAWAIDAASFGIEGMLSGTGHGRIEPIAEGSQPSQPGAVRPGEGWQFSRGELTLTELQLPAAWQGLMQPFLAGTPFAEVDSEGVVSGRLRIAAGSPAEFSLRLDDVSLEARDGGLALYDVDGRLAWRGTGVAAPDEPVELSWSGGYLYGIPFGAAALRFELGHGEWALASPARIPVLDGALEIEELAFGDFTPGNARVAFDARLAPVGLRGLTRALGWPPFSGTLAGELPSLRYRDGELTLGGELVARVFDGEIRIAELAVTDLLAASARCTADVDIRGLDLEQVTEAFSFGLITGRLDGFVQGLELYGWSPVAFDARLYTPLEDRSRHRISQRAVDNIASLGGGGGAAALSQGFLRFFEDFRYDRMALGCRLQDEVCHMSGLQATESGYLILRGSGLPRIDVIGYAEAVSWPTLVEQLRSVIESEGPVVE